MACYIHKADIKCALNPFVRRCSQFTTPNTGKRGEKRAEGGNELDTRQGVGSSAHLKLEKNTVLMAGMVSRRGTRPSSMHILSLRATTRPSPRGVRSIATLDCPKLRQI